MNFYRFHIGDYASATRHLSWIEDAAYRRLLDVYYVREQPLPADLRQVFRLVVASDDEQREAVETVLSEFFVLTEHGYTHSRCEEEICAANDKKEKASLSAQRRWCNANNESSALPSESERNANASNASCERIADASKELCEGNAPTPTPTPNKKQNLNTASPIGFAEFWSAYPRKIGKGAAESAWKKLRPDLQAVLTAIERARQTEQWRKDGGQYIPHPATWLNQRRWEDESAMGLSLLADDPYSRCVDLDKESLPAGMHPPRNGERRYFPGVGWCL